MSFFAAIAALASRRFDAAECPDCPPGPPGADPAFTTAVTALGAKLARADGLADPGEQQAFLNVFQPEARAQRDVLQLYELARQTTLGFESYARRLSKRYRNCPQLLEDVLDGLFHIATSDGRFNDAEDAYLAEVARLFALSERDYHRIRASHIGLHADDPHAVLGIEPGASLEVARRARNRLLASLHPDKIRARGLPSEYEAVFTAKAARINTAFDALRAMHAAPVLN
ncbi:MAG: TerB family tellurite resistance protein [Asticcacaulis sp.]